MENAVATTKDQQVQKTEDHQEQYSSINLLQNASMLKITADEQDKLTKAFDENEIEIRPDGLIYLPQTFWRKRLNESFGIGQWCLIVKGNHKDPNPQKDKLYLQGVLMVRGAYVAEAVGEAELHSSNPMQSWASVWESAKSDCITRCCKDLGIASELWQPEFIRTWTAKYAVQVWRDKTGKKKDGSTGSFQWRKKTTPKFYDETFAKQSDAPAKESKITPNPKANAPHPINILPTINEKQYAKVVERIKAGEKIIDQLLKTYTLTDAQLKELSDIYEASVKPVNGKIELTKEILKEIKSQDSASGINAVYYSHKELHGLPEFNEAIQKRKKEILLPA